MKVYVCLTFVAAVLFLQVAEAAAVEAVQHDEMDLDTAMKVLFVNIHRILPCGVEQYGIPSLAPFHLKDYEFKRNSSIFNTSGRVSNLYIYGLDDVEILTLNFNSTTRRLSFDVLVKEIQILAEYNLTSDVSLNNYPVQYSGEGLINNKFTGFRTVGHLDLLPAIKNSNGLRIDNIKLNFYLAGAAITNVNHSHDNALNNFVNKFLSEGILTAVQQVQKYTDGYIAQLLLELGVNEKLEKVSERDIVAKISDLIVLLQTVNCTDA